MKHSLKSILAVGMLLTTSLAFTSCDGAFDDVFGEWDKPTPAEATSTPEPSGPSAATISFASASKDWGTLDGNFTLAVTNTGDGVVSYSSADPAIATINPSTGEVTPLTAGTTTITATVSNSDNSIYESQTAQYTLTVGTGYRYLEWNKTTEVFDVKYATGTPLEGAVANTAITNGTYIIKGNVSITGNVTANVELILLDGSNLDITGKVDADTKTLTIYAQSEGSDMGQMNVDCNNGSALFLKSLTIHGGKLTAKGTYTTTPGCGIKTTGNVYIYGGEVKAQAGDDASTAEGGYGIWLYSGLTYYTIYIMNHAKVEAVGAKRAGNKGGHGIYGNVEISGDAELIATGGDCSKNICNGGNGIFKNLTASGHAKVTAKGGNGIDNNVIGGMGVASKAIVSDYAQLIATGGNGHGSKEGGLAIGSLEIHDNAYVEASGGNGGSSGNGGYAIINYIDYYGGKFVALAGTKGASGASDGKAMDAFYNRIVPNAVAIEYTTNGSTWTGLNVTGTSNNTEVQNRGVRKLD